ncbi:hypothetical protein G7054_g4160 [Neopestalotiopsis clavispora]|nr:hypothetical protein G7054_g4160 [Neopestalotiopsis clavispora]
MTWQLENDHAEEEPLYTSSNDAESISPTEKNSSKRRSTLQSRINTVAAIAYIILLMLYIRLWFGLRELQSMQDSASPDLFPSSSSALRQDIRQFPLTVAGTPFAGDPSQELDDAWHELLEGTVIRVSEEDLNYYNVTSLPLADGSGFASELFVTHELHCLKKVRQWIYKDTYFTNVQGLARNELKRHIGMVV